MKPFKFRVWVPAEKTMLTWLCLCQTAFNQQSVGDQHNAKEIFVPLIYKAFTHPDWIRQAFTGLTDKNGKEIYEGDIVKLYTWQSEEEPELDDFTIHQIHWGGDYPAFDLKPYPQDWESNGLQEATSDPGGEGYQIEVIGNIYENPQLWESRKI